MKYILGLVVESDNDYIDKPFITSRRFFEKEVLKCVTHWRKFGDQYKDIDIICICITKNVPSNETIEKLKKMNVTFIHHYDPLTDTFDCGFYNKVLGCKIIEQYYINVKDYVMLHIDLDMYLLKKPFITNKNSCLIYDEIQTKFERKIIDKNLNTYNTCYIISVPGFYNKWYDKLIWTINNYKLLNINNLDYRKIEELSFDLLSEDIHIEPICDLIFGETYTDFNDIIFKDNICFHHYHIYDTLKYNWIKDYKKYKEYQDGKNTKKIWN